MIIVSEVVHGGEVHLQFNSCFLEMMSYVFPNKKILFRSEIEHNNAVLLCTEKNENINFVSFNKYYDLKRYSWPSRIFGEIKEIYRSLKLGKELKADVHVWTCLFPTGHLFLNLYLFFNRKRTKHLIVLHGELELLKAANRRKSEIFLGIVLRAAINLSSKFTEYVVLGERIKIHLRKYVLKSVFSRIIDILHPYKYDENVLNKKFQASLAPIKLGSIGTQMLSKNSNYIFELAEFFAEEIGNERLEFLTVGRVLSEVNLYNNEYVKQLYTDCFVPQSVFENVIRKLDFVLFFYDDNSYQLCASGAIFEAIKLGLPIVSIKNDYFDWLFSKYGNMGFLCASLWEMESLIKNIIEGRLDKEISAIIENIIKFKKHNNTKSISLELLAKL